MISNMSFGFCPWDIPAVILLAVVAVALIKQSKKDKSKEAEEQGEIE